MAKSSQSTAAVATSPAEGRQERKARRAERRARKVARAAKREAKSPAPTPASTSSKKTGQDPEYEAALTLFTLGADDEAGEQADERGEAAGDGVAGHQSQPVGDEDETGDQSEAAEEGVGEAQDDDNDEDNDVTRAKSGKTVERKPHVIDPALQDTTFPSLAAEPTSLPSGQTPPTLAEVTQPPQAEAEAESPKATGATRTKSKRTAGARPARKRAKTDATADMSPRERLTNRWLDNKELKELVDETGIQVKMGKFSAVENDTLRAAVEAYRLEHSMTSSEMEVLIQATAKERKSGEKDHGNFWFHLTQALDGRAVFGVYHHVRRLFHPDAYKGKFKDDEIRTIEQLHKTHGNEWEKIAGIVGRTPGDVRDFCRHELGKSKDHAIGRWGREEQQKFEKIIDKHVKQYGANELSGKANWKEISNEMAGTRSPLQCRAKWHQSYETKYKMNLTQEKWKIADFYMLVKLCAQEGKSHESEIDFKNLSAPNWDYWTRPIKRNKLAYLRKMHPLEGHEALSWPEEVAAYVRYFENKYAPHELEVPAERFEAAA